MVLGNNINTNEQGKFRETDPGVGGEYRTRVGIVVEQDPLDPIPVIGDGASSPEVQNIATPVAANTEFAITIPSATKAFILKVRDPVRLQISFTVGETGTTYMTVNPGFAITQDGLALTADLIIYAQCAQGSQTVEVIQWS